MVRSTLVSRGLLGLWLSLDWALDYHVDGRVLVHSRLDSHYFTEDSLVV